MSPVERRQPELIDSVMEGNLVGDQHTNDVNEATPMVGPGDVGAAAPLRWGTVWVWLLALMPWVVAACVVLAIFVVLATELSISLALPAWSWLPLLTVPYLLAVLFAALDAWQLRAWRHPAVAPWTWAFLGAPVYLVTRALTLEPRARGSLRPMWVGLVSTALATLTTVVGLGVVVALAAYFLSLLADSYNTTVF